MQKLFRFKYEPCKGDCYAWCDTLPEELNKLTEEQRHEVIAEMVTAHNNLCDNPSYSFGIDRDSARDMFVAHYRYPEGTDTFLAGSFYECVKRICAEVKAAIIPQVTGACSYGDNGAEDLGREILRACTDEVYRKEHHDSCPCHAKTA